MQVTLSQVISGLRESLHSIDMRAAVKKSDSGWERVLTGIRISTRSVEAIGRRHAELEERFGRRQSNLFRVLFQALPSAELEALMGELAQGRVTVEGVPISLSGKLLFDKLQGRVQRHDEFVGPWDAETWPGISFLSGEGSAVYHQPDVTAAIRGSLGFRSVEEMVDSFLEVTGSSNRQANVFIRAEMPAKIKTVRVVGKTVEVQVSAEKNLSPVHLFLSRKDSRGRPVHEHHEIVLKPVGEEGIYTLLRAEAQLDSVDETDLLSCVLTHPALPELDEESRRLKSIMPAEERSTLLECLKQFWDMERLYQEVERPYETETRRRQERPQDAFQKSVARLLSPLGHKYGDVFIVALQTRMWHSQLLRRCWECHEKARIGSS